MSDDGLSDIIRRAQRKDADAFDALIDLFGRRLFGFFCRLTGSRTEAEDLLQEVFLRVVRRIEQYEHDGQFEAWLFRIASNLVRDRIRRLRRRPASHSLDGGPDGDYGRSDSAAALLMDQDAASPSDAASHSEEADRLQGALAMLNDSEREVLMLRHYSQMSFAEIALAMKTPLGTALARAHRGLLKLRKILEIHE